jgi:hypothetical protein
LDTITGIIVTGTPGGSIVFMDGLPTGQATAVNDHPQIADLKYAKSQPLHE